MDLGTRLEAPIQIVDPTAPYRTVGENLGSSLFGWAPDAAVGWVIYRLFPGYTPVRKGAGSLCCVSDEHLVTFAGGHARVETLEGKLISTVDAAPVQIIEPGRLYVGGTSPRLIDFAGHELRRFPSREGWGLPPRWSSAGRRVLFDNYISTSTALRELIEKRLTAPEDDNGEIVRVIDVLSGNICLEWDSPAKRLGIPGRYHVDISPSGQLLAAITGSDISIYRLAETCNQRHQQ